MIANESESALAFAAQCKRYRIFTTQCATREKAINEIRSYPWRYDAVLLTEAACPASEFDVDDPVDLKELANAIEASGKPYFVFAPEYIDLSSSFDTRRYVPGMDNEDLIDAIVASVDRMPRHALRSVAFGDVFTSLEFIGANKDESEPLLMQLLAGMFCPETEEPFDIPTYYQWQRLLVGCVMNGCRAMGLVPDECYHENDEENLFDCHNYLGGRSTRYAGVRFGVERKDKKGRDISDRILSTAADHLLSALLHVGDVHSSTAKLSEEDYTKLSIYFQNNNSRYQLYGYTLQLCSLINELASYVLTHQNKEENLAMRRPAGTKSEGMATQRTAPAIKNTAVKHVSSHQFPAQRKEQQEKPCESQEIAKAEDEHLEPLPPEIAEKYEGKVFLAEQDGNAWHCGDCLVVGRYGFKGKMLRLKNVRVNENPNKKYPYFAHFEIVKPEGEEEA